MKKNKVINTLTIIGEIVGVIFIFLYVYIHVNQKPINNLDELWNFNTAKVIAQGLIPYKDISMITTPLAPTIVAIIFNIIGISLFNYRIIVSVFITLFFILLYTLINFLTRKKLISFSIVLFMASFYIQYNSFDYNHMSLTLLILIELIEIIIIKRYFEGKKEKQSLNILNGLLIGILILTKQTTGIIIAAGLVFTPLLFIKNVDNKSKIKIIGAKIVGIIIPVLSFAIYLLATNSLKDFIDYCLLGVTHFNNKVSYLKTIKQAFDSKNFKDLIIVVEVMICSVLLLVRIIVNLIKRKNKKNKTTEKKIIADALSFFAILSLCFIYPISDVGHIMFSAYPIIVVMTYFYASYFEVQNKDSKARSIISLIAITIIISIIIGYDCYISSTNKLDGNLKKSDIKYYENLYIQDFLEERIIEVDSFIEENEAAGKKVYIVNSEAAIYEIPIDRYNKNYSMFLNGNIGKDGADGIIEKIKEEENVIYLVLSPKYALNWQVPKDVINYIRSNLEKKGTVGIYDYYISTKSD